MQLLQLTLGDRRRDAAEPPPIAPAAASAAVSPVEEAREGEPGPVHVLVQVHGDRVQEHRHDERRAGRHVPRGRKVVVSAMEDFQPREQLL